MANTYVVSSASYIAGSAPDPLVTIIGSVNGIAVTVTVWLSALVQANTAGGLTAVKNLIAPIMLSQSAQNAPPAPTVPTQLPTGTFTQ
jgi:hypothetical protein